METPLLDSSKLSLIIEEKLATGADFKKVKKELIRQGYQKREVDKAIKSSDQYQVYSAYSIFYALGVLVIIYGIIMLLTAPGIILTGIVLFAGVTYAVLGVMTSRSNITALYAGIGFLGIILLSNLVTLNILGALVSMFFLLGIIRGVNPMRRILAKGQRVTRAF